MREFLKEYSVVYDELISSLNHQKYWYIDNGTYMKIVIQGGFQGSVKEGMKIYWREMLYRIHFVATSSLLRNGEWIKGIVFGLERNNTMMFCSSLRGFLESVTDSFYSLEAVPTALSLNYKNIVKCLDERMNKMFHAEELEKVLIHYEFAAKGDEEKSLSANSYIKEYDECSGVDTKRLYSRLCEIVHPAAGSLSCFQKEVVVNENISYMTTCYNENTAIEKICRENENCIKILVRMSIILPGLCLKILNAFHNFDIYTEYMDSKDMDRFLDKEKMKVFEEMMEQSKEYYP